MQRLLIIATNCGLLALLLIGLPAATRAHLGNVQFSSATTVRLVIFWGLILAASANVALSFMPFIGRKQRFLCWEWVLVFGGLVGVQYAFTHGHLNFVWLKQSLEWLQSHL